jgi:hypothetical protein
MMARLRGSLLRKKAKGKNIDPPFSQNFLLKKQEVEALQRRVVAEAILLCVFAL